MSAFKACAPIAWSPHLYITLVRGILGTRRLHRRTLEALRVGKCNRTVMRWNTPTVRGMLQQVLGSSLSNKIWGEEVGCDSDRRNVQGPQRERGKPLTAIDY